MNTGRLGFGPLIAAVVVVSSCGTPREPGAVVADQNPAAPAASSTDVPATTSATTIEVATTGIPRNAAELVAEQIVGTTFALGGIGPLREIGDVGVPEGTELIRAQSMDDGFGILVYRMGGFTGVIAVVGPPKGEGSGPYSYEVEFATAVQFSGLSAVETLGSDCGREGGDKSETIVATVSPETDRTLQAWRVSSKAPYIETVDADSVTCLAGDIEGTDEVGASVVPGSPSPVEG